MLLTGLVTGISGIAFFLYGMNPDGSERICITSHNDVTGGGGGGSFAPIWHHEENIFSVLAEMN